MNLNPTEFKLKLITHTRLGINLTSGVSPTNKVMITTPSVKSPKCNRIACWTNGSLACRASNRWRCVKVVFCAMTLQHSSVPASIYLENPTYNRRNIEMFCTHPIQFIYRTCDGHFPSILLSLNWFQYNRFAQRLKLSTSIPFSSVKCSSPLC